MLDSTPILLNCTNSKFCLLFCYCFDRIVKRCCVDLIDKEYACDLMTMHFLGEKNRRGIFRRSMVSSQRIVGRVRLKNFRDIPRICWRLKQSSYQIFFRWWFCITRLKILWKLLIIFQLLTARLSLLRSALRMIASILIIHKRFIPINRKFKRRMIAIVSRGLRLKMLIPRQSLGFLLGSFKFDLFVRKDSLFSVGSVSRRKVTLRSNLLQIFSKRV